MSKALRVAVAGAGYFAGFHLDSWRRMGRAEPVAVCDRDRARAEATGLPAFTDVAAMLAASTPDILDIALPPDAHAEAIRAGLAAGVPTIICQKPFCRDLSEARAVTSEAEAAGARLVVHENFRFQPWYRELKRALEAGAIGTPMQLTFRLRPGDGQGPRAYLDRQPYFQTMRRFLVHETAVHWIDTFRYLMGEPRAVWADLRRLNPAIAGEDAGHILFWHEGAARSLFDGNRHLDHASDNLRRTMGEGLAEGTEGAIRLTGDGALHLRRFGAREEEMILPPDRHRGFGGDCVHALQSHVVAAILDGAPLENPARDYLRVIEIEEAVYRSAESGCRVELGPSD